MADDFVDGGAEDWLDRLAEEASALVAVVLDEAVRRRTARVAVAAGRRVLGDVVAAEGDPAAAGRAEAGVATASEAVADDTGPASGAAAVSRVRVSETRQTGLHPPVRCWTCLRRMRFPSVILRD